MAVTPQFLWDYKMIFIGDTPSTPRFEELAHDGWHVASADRGRVLLKRLRYKDMIQVIEQETDE